MKLTTRLPVLNQKFNKLNMIRDVMKTEDLLLKDCKMIIEKYIKTTNLLINV